MRLFYVFLPQCEYCIKVHHKILRIIKFKPNVKRSRKIASYSLLCSTLPWSSFSGNVWHLHKQYIAEESVIEIENRLAALWKRFAVLRFCLPINPSTFSCGERGDAATRTRTSKEITLQFFTPILLHHINICTFEDLITSPKKHLSHCLKMNQNVAFEFWHFPQILSY